MTADALALDLLRILSPPLSQPLLSTGARHPSGSFQNMRKHNFLLACLFKIRHRAIHGLWVPRQIESSASYYEGHLRSVPEDSASFSASPSPPSNESRERSFGFRCRHFVGRSFSAATDFSPQVEKLRVAVWLCGADVTIPWRSVFILQFKSLSDSWKKQ